MDYVALILQGTFLVLAFGVRTALHLRRTGSTGFRAGAARRSPVEALGAGAITVAALMSFIAVVIVVAGIIEPLGGDAFWLGATGTVLTVAGIVLVVKAQSDMGGSWRIGVDQSERTELVTSGLFRFSRNPIFLGMLMFWLGIAAMVPSPFTLAAAVIAFVGIEIQVRLVEEPYLLRNHEDTYREYASRTGRLMPGIGKLTRSA
jgi:protein-S-isoprenylcysteine O-methyltransferase Ste14